MGSLSKGKRCGTKEEVNWVCDQVAEGLRAVEKEIDIAEEDIVMYGFNNLDPFEETIESTLCEKRHYIISVMEEVLNLQQIAREMRIAFQQRYASGKSSNSKTVILQVEPEMIEIKGSPESR